MARGELKFAHQRARGIVGHPNFALIIVQATVNVPLDSTGGLTESLSLCITSGAQIAHRSLRDGEGVGLCQTTVFSRHLVVTLGQSFDTRGLLGHVVLHYGGKCHPVGTGNGVFHRASHGRAVHHEIHHAFVHAGQRAVHDTRFHTIVIDVEIERVAHGAVTRFLRCRHSISLRTGQTGEGVGEIGVAGRVGVQRRVFIVLIKHLVFDVLHTAHLRHLDFHPTRAITTGVDGRGDQVERTHRGTGRQFEMVSFPIRSRRGGGTRRFGVRLHHVVAFGQIEERDAFVGARAALRADRRVAIRTLVERERRFGESGGAGQVSLHTATRTDTVTGGRGGDVQLDRFGVLRVDASHAPPVRARIGATLGGDAHVKVFSVHRGRHFRFHRCTGSCRVGLVKPWAAAP